MTTVTQTQLVAVALYLLGGDARVVDTEDVAVRVHELAPGRFSWRKYPEQINLELVRVALNDARKPETRALVSGKGNSGWSLTVAGRHWVEENLDRVTGADLRSERKDRTAGSIDERRWHRERRRVRTTDAWKQWSESADPSAISRDAAADLFRVDRYVVGRAREMKVNRLREMFGDDEELAGLLDAAAAVLLKEEASNDSH